MSRRKEGTMSVVEATTTVWVVLDGAAEVVLMCEGADAAEVAEEWAKRGYTTVQVSAAPA